MDKKKPTIYSKRSEINLGIDRPSLSYLFFFFIDEPTRTTSIKNLKKQQQPKNCAQPKKDKG